MTTKSYTKDDFPLDTRGVVTERQPMVCQPEEPTLKCEINVCNPNFFAVFSTECSIGFTFTTVSKGGGQRAAFPEQLRSAVAFGNHHQQQADAKCLF